MSDYELMNVVTVGGNPVSAFLSWRLQATNACDVTLVWKNGFEHVSQYGISFKYAPRARLKIDSSVLTTLPVQIAQLWKRAV